MTVLPFPKESPKPIVPRPRSDEGSIALGLFAAAVAFLALFGGVTLVRDVIVLVHPAINACASER